MDDDEVRLIVPVTIIDTVNTYLRPGPFICAGFWLDVTRVDEHEDDVLLLIGFIPQSYN